MHPYQGHSLVILANGYSNQKSDKYYDSQHCFDFGSKVWIKVSILKTDFVIYTKKGPEIAPYSKNNKIQSVYFCVGVYEYNFSIYMRSSCRLRLHNIMQLSAGWKSLAVFRRRQIKSYRSYSNRSFALHFRWVSTFLWGM